MRNEGLFTSERSVILSTYMLCGFANIASIGIQIGGIGVLAPSRRKDLSELSIKALIAGTVASLYTAAIVGLMI
jgi:CNT family concentrative nucleoside transporter